MEGTIIQVFKKEFGVASISIYNMYAAGLTCEKEKEFRI